MSPLPCHSQLVEISALSLPWLQLLLLYLSPWRHSGTGAHMPHTRTRALYTRAGTSRYARAHAHACSTCLNAPTTKLSRKIAPTLLLLHSVLPPPATSKHETKEMGWTALPPLSAWEAIPLPDYGVFLPTPSSPPPAFPFVCLLGFSILPSRPLLCSCLSLPAPQSLRVLSALFRPSEVETVIPPCPPSWGPHGGLWGQRDRPRGPKGLSLQILSCQPLLLGEGRAVCLAPWRPASW